MDEPESPFICKICYSNYDDENKKPVIMTPCSHTICKSCLSNILLLNKTCPFCKKEIKGDISDIKPNYELVDIIYQLKTNNITNGIKCARCKQNVKTVYIEEKNSSINFLCGDCGLKEKSENIIPLDDMLKNIGNDIDKYKNLLNYKINKDFIKNEICFLMTEYLKKTICELLEQKKDLFESFIELPDFLKMIDNYRKSLDNIINSKENSIKFVEANCKSITPTIKDSIVNNILNLRNVNTNEKLNIKINCFEQTIEKEFNKNKLYLQSILQTLTNEIIYQSNIAVYNTIKETLKDDFSLLEKITMTNSNILNNTSLPFNSANFQQNHIQLGTIFSEMQLQQQLNNLELDEVSQNLLKSNLNSGVVQENNSVSIIGLIKEKHRSKDAVKKLLEEGFECKATLFNKDDKYYGCQLNFPTRKKMEKFLEKKKYTLEYEEEKKVVLFKKENKTGNRLYVKYI